MAKYLLGFFLHQTGLNQYILPFLECVVKCFSTFSCSRLSPYFKPPMLCPGVQPVVILQPVLLASLMVYIRSVLMGAPVDVRCTAVNLCTPTLSIAQTTQACGKFQRGNAHKRVFLFPHFKVVIIAYFGFWICTGGGEAAYP